MDRDSLTPEEGRLLELLGILIEEYENRVLPLPKSSPHEMLAYLLQEKKHEAGGSLARIAQEPSVRKF
jgi:hypothetical protein